MAGFSTEPFALSVADEATFGDDSNVTFDERMPILAPVDVSGFTQAKIPMGRAMQYTNSAETHIRGPYDASFTAEYALTGFGSTTVGTLSAATQLGTQLGRIIGNNSVATVGGTVASSPTSATEFVVTGGTMLSAGLVRVGAQSESRGGGQWYVVDNLSTTTVFNALEATPNLADVVYASELIYPNEDATADTLVSQRMQFQSASGIHRAWGVYPTGISITLPLGGIGRVSATYGAAKAVPLGSAPTWPNATAKDEFAGQPIGGGQLHVQDVGTTTRAILTMHGSLQLTIDLQVVPHPGPVSTDPYQIISGATRTMCQATVSFRRLAEASGTNTAYDDWNTDTGTNQRLVYGASVGRDGASIGMSFPNALNVGTAPIMQVEDGLWIVETTYLCGTTAVTTNALTLANFVIGLG